jgi:acetyl esterase/lipase
MRQAATMRHLHKKGFGMKKIIAGLLLVHLAFSLQAQDTLALYEGALPNAKGQGTNGAGPTLTVFQPPKERRTGMGIIVMPGGGYSSVVVKKEGYDVARMLNEWGVTAFVLRYRLPSDSTMRRKETGPLQDAQRAMQLVRMRAEEWGLAPGQIGIMGFSAGGHLAATLGTHFKKALVPNPQRVRLRPDFMVLAYPVISFTDSLAHPGSKLRLLGERPSKKLVRAFSLERRVTKKTPPAFLVHAKDDNKVPVGNSLVFYNALRKKKVPAELFLYEKGSHGFALNNTTSPEKWTDRLRAWLAGRCLCPGLAPARQ